MKIPVLKEDPKNSVSLEKALEYMEKTDPGFVQETPRFHFRNTALGTRVLQDTTGKQLGSISKVAERKWQAYHNQSNQKVQYPTLKSARAWLLVQLILEWRRSGDQTSLESLPNPRVDGSSPCHSANK